METYPSSAGFDDPAHGQDQRIEYDQYNVEEDMTSRAPPSGWEVTGGVWGVDIDREETTVLSGNSGIVFPSTGTALSPAIMSPWISIASQASLPSTNGAGRMRYDVFTRFRADAATALDTFSLTLHYYDASRTSIGSFNYFAGFARIANTWLSYGITFVVPTNAQFVRVEILKPINNFNLYIDSNIVQREPANGLMIAGIGQAIPTGGAATRLALSALATNYEISYDTTLDEWYIDVPGLYLISVAAAYIGMLDTEAAWVQPYVNAAGVGIPGWATMSGASGILTPQMTLAYRLNSGDLVSFYGSHTSAGSRTCDSLVTSIVRIAD